MCGKGVEPLDKADVIGSRGDVTSPSSGSSAERPGTVVSSAPRPVLSQRRRLRGAGGGTAPLIGPFVRDCSVICYHNNPLKEACRPGEAVPEAQPNPFKGKAQPSALRPSLCNPRATARPYPPSSLPPPPRRPRWGERRLWALPIPFAARVAGAPDSLGGSGRWGCPSLRELRPEGVAELTHDLQHAASHVHKQKHLGWFSRVDPPRKHVYCEFVCKRLFPRDSEVFGSPLGSLGWVFNNSHASHSLIAPLSILHSWEQP